MGVPITKLLVCEMQRLSWNEAPSCGGVADARTGERCSDIVLARHDHIHRCLRFES